MSIKRIDVIKEKLGKRDVEGVSNIKESGRGLVVNYKSGVSTYYRWENFTDDKIADDIVTNSKGIGKEFSPQRAKLELVKALSAEGYRGSFGPFECTVRSFTIVKKSTGEKIKYKINFNLIKNSKQVEKQVKDIITAFEWGYAFPNYDEIYVEVRKLPMFILTVELSYLKVWDDEEKQNYYIYYYRKASNGSRIYLKDEEVKGNEEEIAEKIKATMKGKYNITNYKGKDFLVQSTIGESAASILFEKDAVEVFFGKKPMVAFVDKGIVIKKADK